MKDSFTTGVVCILIKDLKHRKLRDYSKHLENLVNNRWTETIIYLQLLAAQRFGEALPFNHLNTR